jgi:hypothetical protein
VAESADDAVAADVTGMRTSSVVAEAAEEELVAAVGGGAGAELTDEGAAAPESPLGLSSLFAVC